MNGHFRAFSFVDRITAFEAGTRVRGQYTIPPAVEAFPSSLVAEAVGQLAAWAAMDAVDFTHRPVAGIAGTIQLLSAVRPGQVLELTAELESVDTDTAGYSGAAQVNGTPVIQLSDCVGPMVPVEEFDDPRLLRERLNLLRSVGAVPGAFPGLPSVNLEYDGGTLTPLPLPARCRQHVEEQGHVHAMFKVPSSAPFFADHFPRRPVLPGTLLMHANLEAAARLAPAGWAPRIISDVKLRAFIAPGEVVSLEASRIGHSDRSLTVAVESRTEQRLVGTAEIEFACGSQA